MHHESFSALSVFAVLPVKNLEESVIWYTKLFGRKPDHQPVPSVADYYLSADNDPRKGTLQLIVDTGRAGGGLASINVSSIETVHQSLQANDVSFDTVTVPIQAQEVSSIVISTVIDPNGNAISIIQAN